MNAQELSALIKQAQTGDTEGYAQLYAAVYRPVYKIARMAMKSEDAAVEAVRLTVLDSFAALPAARLTSSPQFIEWLVKILCTKIRHINKTGGELCTKTDSGSEIRNALNDLPDIERLVLSVSTVCGCSAEKTAKLCGYTEETVGVCLTNAEVTLKAQLLSGSNI
ncbi:Sigma-70, region 4./ECF sigma factor [[Eubacterium] siraeum V10Sc8a]|uniref:Sigma-70, region 4./ECF sigma factor n=1 Tax=[Eubacterium] siraeum V10Sc8a TaxID=717961 RepID=D4MI49_9FIRM|nr:Sigma-70, region 4./ECF sigma factor [[Eubacterium] siraeum V10Sc8a]